MAMVSVSERFEMDPQSQALLDQFNAANFPDLKTLPVEASRALVESFAWKSTIELKSVEDVVIPTEQKQIPARIYVPKGNGPFPVLVFYHGGGWVLGSINYKDPVCRLLCEQANAIVVSVEYSLAPESKFPDPLNECVEAFLWTAKNIGEFGGDKMRLAIGGDSCGATLAAAVSMKIRDTHPDTHIAYQVLICPVTSYNFDTESYKRFGTKHFVSRDDMKWYWKQYLRTEADSQNPYAAPLLDSGDVSKLPPTLIVLAQFDPLHDDGKLYAKKLQMGGGFVTEITYPTFHGFYDLSNQLEIGHKALVEVSQKLKMAF